LQDEDRFNPRFKPLLPEEDEVPVIFVGKSWAFWAFYGFHSVSRAMLVASFSPSQCYTNQPAFIEDFPLMNSVQ
jgi:hypothetical protein